MGKYLQLLFISLTTAIFAQTPVSVKVKDAAGNESFNVTCNNDLDANGCIALNVEYPVLRQTASYQISQEVYSPPVPLNQGTALNANYDDLFAAKLDLPFKFCFYNQYYQSLIVGSNGMVTFDLNQLGNINYPNIQWTNPSTSLPKNSIFGAYHDIVFSSGDASEIYYSTIGTAPYRKFVINFYEGRVSGCTERSSSQIVLHETTNVIEVFIDKKLTPCPTRKFENALIGVINSDGTQGVSPANRNTGVWQALQEGWKFSPLGNVIEPEVTWTNTAGQTVGTGVQTTVCPTQNEIYTANVKFNICGNENLTLTDAFPLTFDASYPAAKNYTENFCGNTSVNLTLSSFQANLTTQNPANFQFSFHTSLQDAQTNLNALPNNYTLTSNTVLYVRIQNPTVPTCYRVAVLTLNIISKSLIKNIIELCDTNNDGVESNYNVSQLNAELFPPGTTGISYHPTQSDAQNNSNALTTVNISSGTNLWVRLLDGNCTYILGPVSFQFRPGVNINNPVNFTYSVCDINADNQEPFNYASVIGPLITTQTGATFTAYNTFDEAIAGSGTGLNTIKEGIYTIFIRVEIPNGCFAVVTVNMNVTFSKIVANEKKEYICFNGTDDITVNLTTLSSGMLVSPATVPVIEFYATSANANAGINQISPNQTITTDGNLVIKTFFVRFEISDDCFTVRPIMVYLVHPVIVQSAFSICDFNNDNSEIVQLSQFSAAIVGNQNATTIFYQTSADAISGSNPITSITLNGTQQIFVKITSYNCQQIYPVNLSFSSTPAVNPQVNIMLNNICDNNNDGNEIYNLTQAQPQIYSGSDVSFSYYLNYNPSTQVFSNPINNPAQFMITAGSAMVYVKVKFNNSECFSASKLNIQMTFLPAVVLNAATLAKCDEDFNLNETFQLSDAVSQLFIPSQNTYPLSEMTITYYNTAAQANAGNAANQIGPTVTTNVSSVQVWARFQSQTTGCYSVAPIQLNTYFPPKAITSTITVCDENLDGSYEVNLLNFTNLMVDITNPANTFSFYLTQQDAENGTNAIANPDNFTVNPFPGQIWVKVQNIPGCDDIAVVNFTLGNKVTLQNAGPFQLSVCDTANDGVENINLTQFESQIYTGANVTFTYYPSLADLNAGTNVIATPSNFTFNQSSASNIVYVKVSVPGFCSNVVQINLSLKSTPVFDIPTLYFCPEGSLNYTANIEGYTIVSYVWTNPSGQVISTTDTITDITLVGTYTLTVTADNGCTYTATFEIKHYDVPVIQELQFNGNTAVVNATGTQTILYSIDGVTWQATNTFYNLPTGITTFYVKYINSDCIVKQDGVVLDIKNAITPNGDGLNDNWIVKNLHVFGKRMSTVKIFDRYQVLIFEQSSNTQFFWDGTIKGRAIPTSSYWYVITLPDGRTFTGWILVKNNS
ncbi:gliding motility-associated C-terminal domain-containing protein [Chryseobacterium taeanense]|uniref:Gliding motility-associated C-terminal domain-containing protein n=1 Tax=Chryseobacterium taeanense TaxID=311334 RepID=A0A1G8KF62_9FLAO|nr:T9SS type B sorting domain-containing protein [Chryseobacterium taeanense]SDI42046.1 gliding motility-associated C-terminal domain-containing protein [Chryseobacterium taeanense]